MAGGPALDTRPAETPKGAAPPWQVLVEAAREELIGLGVLAALIAVAFAPQLAWMWSRWMASEYYGHGVLIPPIVGYLIYRRRALLAELPKSSDRRGLVLVVAGIVLHFLGIWADVHFVSCLALIPVLLGLVQWLWGPRIALAVLFPICYLGFMVPIDRLLIDAFSSPLQLLAAKMAGTFTQLIGIPVTREGVNLRIPEYAFEVAIACSGIKSLTTMTALAALYAYLTEGRLWQKAALLASSLPIALVANAVRVTTILLVARSLGEKAATGFLHGFSGVVVFMVGLLALYGMGWLLKCHKLRDDI